MHKRVLTTLATFGALTLNSCSIWQMREYVDTETEKRDDLFEPVSTEFENAPGTVVRVWQPNKTNYQRFVFDGTSATDMYFWSVEGMAQPTVNWAQDVAEVARQGYTNRPFVYATRDEDSNSFIGSEIPAQLIDIRMIAVKYGASEKSFARYVIRLDTDGDKTTHEYVGMTTTASNASHRIKWALKRPRQLEAEEDALRIQAALNAQVVYLPLKKYCEKLDRRKPEMTLGTWNKTFLIFKKIPIERIKD